MDEKSEKWQGLVSTKLNSIQPDQAWSTLGDFFNLHKFLPSLATCHKVEGSDNVRYCAGEPDQTGTVSWAKERLVEFNPIKRSYSYEIIESNMGFGSYLAELRVVECDDGGCKIEWGFECEPILGWTRSGFVEYLEGAVKGIAKGVEDALCGNDGNL